MQKPLPACLKNLAFAAILILTSSWSLCGQELLGNGNFEAGRLVPWNVKQSLGSSVALVAENSPFNSIYAGGLSSVQLKDDDSSDFVDQPSLQQSFAPQKSILFGFDFKLPSPGDASPWYVAWNGENNTTGFFFRLGGADGLSIEFNLQKIGDLKANAWYHIEGFADLLGQTVNGTLASTQGESTSFEGTFPFGVKNELDSIVISDGDAARNPDVLLDNVYTRPVTLQIRFDSGGHEVVSWFGSGFTLQSATTLGSAAQWTSIPGAQGSYTNTFGDPVRFFRLIR